MIPPGTDAATPIVNELPEATVNEPLVAIPAAFVGTIEESPPLVKAALPPDS
jgi:hypothetical protein